MRNNVRWLSLWTVGGVVAVLLVLFALWQIFILSATYSALRAAPQGQATGPARSDVTIVEFMDYRCTPCRSLAPVVAAVAQAHPDVRIVYRPVPTHGTESLNEALYALAAGKQGHFLEMNAALLAHADPVKPAELPALCQQANVDCAQLQTDMKGRDLILELANTRRATAALGIRSVPTFLVNRTIYSTLGGMPTADSLDRAIAQARAGAK